MFTCPSICTCQSTSWVPRSGRRPRRVTSRSPNVMTMWYDYVMAAKGGCGLPIPRMRLCQGHGERFDLHSPALSRCCVSRPAPCPQAISIDLANSSIRAEFARNAEVGKGTNGNVACSPCRASTSILVKALIGFQSKCTWHNRSLDIFRLLAR